MTWFMAEFESTEDSNAVDVMSFTKETRNNLILS